MLSKSSIQSSSGTDVFTRNLPAHLNLYFSSFCGSMPIKDQIADTSKNNFAANFAQVASFWESRFNQSVKFDYRHAPIDKIVGDMSTQLKAMR